MSPALEIVICPICGRPNTDDWPLCIDGQIKTGGCQECWEKLSDDQYWEMMEALVDLFKQVPEIFEDGE